MNSLHHSYKNCLDFVSEKWWCLAANDDCRVKHEEVQAGFALLQNLHFRHPWRSHCDTIRAKTTVAGVLLYTTVRKAGSWAKGYDISYVHGDHLGSTDSITSKTATLDTRMLFDPFGGRRKPSGADADQAYLDSLQELTFETTSNGFTGHEQIDSVTLVHMGGRMYDPTLGRFLSPDSVVQYPEISQSYNRYSYVLNNPLSLVDPSGEEATNPEGKGNNEENSGGTNQQDCEGDICSPAGTDTGATQNETDGVTKTEVVVTPVAPIQNEDEYISIDPTIRERRIPGSETFFSPVLEEDGSRRTALVPGDTHTLDILGWYSVIKSAVKNKIDTNPLSIEVGWRDHHEVEVFVEKEHIEGVIYNTRTDEIGDIVGSPLPPIGESSRPVEPAEDRNHDYRETGNIYREPVIKSCISDNCTQINMWDLQ